MPKGSYKENILALSKQDMSQITTLLAAALKATQYTAFESEGKSFKLLEGSVKQNEKGEYIFKPSKTLQALLDRQAYPVLEKDAETRFMKLIALALQEIQ